MSWHAASHSRVSPSPSVLLWVGFSFIVGNLSLSLHTEHLKQDCSILMFMTIWSLPKDEKSPVHFITKPVLLGEMDQCHDPALTKTPSVKPVNGWMTPAPSFFYFNEILIVFFSYQMKKQAKQGYATSSWGKTTPAAKLKDYSHLPKAQETWRIWNSLSDLMHN